MTSPLKSKWSSVEPSFQKSVASKSTTPDVMAKKLKTKANTAESEDTSENKIKNSPEIINESSIPSAKSLLKSDVMEVPNITNIMKNKKVCRINEHNPFTTSFLMWENDNKNVCWLDASMALIVHNRTLQQRIDENSHLQVGKIIWNYNKSVNIINDYSDPSCISDRILIAKELLLEAQDSCLKYLQAPMKPKENQPDSAFCALINLLAEDNAVKKLFEVSFSKVLNCQRCGFYRITKYEKTIITLPNVMEFKPDVPISIFQCPKCKEHEQNMIFKYKSLPQCLVIHFENGAGVDEEFSLDDFKMNDRVYKLSGVLILEKRKEWNFNHFVTWVRDLDTDGWLECNDLNSDMLCFTSVPPHIKPEDVYIVMYEALDGAGTIPYKPSFTDSEEKWDSEAELVHSNSNILLIDISDESENNTNNTNKKETSGTFEKNDSLYKTNKKNSISGSEYDKSSKSQDNSGSELPFSVETTESSARLFGEMSHAKKDAFEMSTQKYLATVPSKAEIGIIQDDNSGNFKQNNVQKTSNQFCSNEKESSESSNHNLLLETQSEDIAKKFPGATATSECFQSLIAKVNQIYSDDQSCKSQSVEMDGNAESYEESKVTQNKHENIEHFDRPSEFPKDNLSESQIKFNKNSDSSVLSYPVSNISTVSKNNQDQNISFTEKEQVSHSNKEQIAMESKTDYVSDETHKVTQIMDEALMAKSKMGNNVLKVLAKSRGKKVTAKSDKKVTGTSVNISNAELCIELEGKQMSKDLDSSSIEDSKLSCLNNNYLNIDHTYVSITENKFVTISTVESLKKGELENEAFVEETKLLKNEIKSTIPPTAELQGKIEDQSFVEKQSILTSTEAKTNLSVLQNKVLEQKSNISSPRKLRSRKTSNSGRGRLSSKYVSKQYLREISVANNDVQNDPVLSTNNETEKTVGSSLIIESGKCQTSNSHSEIVEESKLLKNEAKYLIPPTTQIPKKIEAQPCILKQTMLTAYRTKVSPLVSENTVPEEKSNKSLQRKMTTPKTPINITGQLLPNHVPRQSFHEIETVNSDVKNDSVLSINNKTEKTVESSSVIETGMHHLENNVCSPNSQSEIVGESKLLKKEIKCLIPPTAEIGKKVEAQPCDKKQTIQTSHQTKENSLVMENTVPEQKSNIFSTRKLRTRKTSNSGRGRLSSKHVSKQSLQEISAANNDVQNDSTLSKNNKAKKIVKVSSLTIETGMCHSENTVCSSNPSSDIVQTIKEFNTPTIKHYGNESSESGQLVESLIQSNLCKNSSLDPLNEVKVKRIDEKWDEKEITDKKLAGQEFFQSYVDIQTRRVKVKIIRLHKEIESNLISNGYINLKTYVLGSNGLECSTKNLKPVKKNDHLLGENKESGIVIPKSQCCKILDDKLKKFNKVVLHETMLQNNSEEKYPQLNHLENTSKEKLLEITNKHTSESFVSEQDTGKHQKPVLNANLNKNQTGSRMFSVKAIIEDNCLNGTTSVSKLKTRGDIKIEPMKSLVTLRTTKSVPQNISLRELKSTSVSCPEDNLKINPLNARARRQCKSTYRKELNPEALKTQNIQEYFIIKNVPPKKVIQKNNRNCTPDLTINDSQDVNSLNSEKNLSKVDTSTTLQEKDSLSNIISKEIKSDSTFVDESHYIGNKSIEIKSNIVENLTKNKFSKKSQCKQKIVSPGIIDSNLVQQMPLEVSHSLKNVTNSSHEKNHRILDYSPEKSVVKKIRCQKSLKGNKGFIEIGASSTDISSNDDLQHPVEAKCNSGDISHFFEIPNKTYIRSPEKKNNLNGVQTLLNPKVNIAEKCLNSVLDSEKTVFKVSSESEIDRNNSNSTPTKTRMAQTTVYSSNKKRGATVITLEEVKNVPVILKGENNSNNNIQNSESNELFLKNENSGMLLKQTTGILQTETATNQTTPVKKRKIIVTKKKESETYVLLSEKIHPKSPVTSAKREKNMSDDIQNPELNNEHFEDANNQTTPMKKRKVIVVKNEALETSNALSEKIGTHPKSPVRSPKRKNNPNVFENIHDPELSDDYFVKKLNFDILSKVTSDVSQVRSEVVNNQSTLLKKRKAIGTVSPVKRKAFEANASLHSLQDSSHSEPSLVINQSSNISSEIPCVQAHANDGVANLPVVCSNNLLTKSNVKCSGKQNRQQKSTQVIPTLPCSGNDCDCRKVDRFQIIDDVCDYVFSGILQYFYKF